MMARDSNVAMTTSPLVDPLAGPLVDPLADPLVDPLVSLLEVRRENLHPAPDNQLRDQPAEEEMQHVRQTLHARLLV